MTMSDRGAYRLKAPVTASTPSQTMARQTKFLASTPSRFEPEIPLPLAEPILMEILFLLRQVLNFSI